MCDVLLSPSHGRQYAFPYVSPSPVIDPAAGVVYAVGNNAYTASATVYAVAVPFAAAGPQASTIVMPDPIATRLMINQSLVSVFRPCGRTPSSAPSNPPPP